PEGHPATGGARLGAGHAGGRVDRALAGRQQPGPHPGRQARLEAPGLATPQRLDLEAHGPVTGGQVVERGPVVGVEADHERAVGPEADPPPGRLLQLGREGRPPGQRRVVEPQQGLLADAGLGDRGQHAGGDRRGARAGGGVDDGHRRAPLGEPPGRRQPDDARPHDDDVGAGAHRSAPPGPGPPRAASTALDTASMRSWVATWGSGASATAAMTATPWAPAPMTASTRSAVMPEMAMTGTSTASTTARSPSR